MRGLAHNGLAPGPVDADRALALCRLECLAAGPGCSFRETCLPYPCGMSCPPIYWKEMAHISTVYGHLGDAGGPSFVVIGSCVGKLDGLRSVKIARKGKPDLWGYAGSLEQAKRHVERWARRHWRTV